MRLRYLREKADKTQSEISKLLHCDQSLYSKYERTERDVPLWIIIRLSFYYDTSLDYIVGVTDESTPYEKSQKFKSNFNFPDKE